MSYEDAVMKTDETEEDIMHVKNILTKNGFNVAFNADATTMYLTKENTIICKVKDFDRLTAIAIGMELAANYKGFIESTL